MNSGYSISLHRLIEEFGFEEIYVPDRNIAITNPGSTARWRLPASSFLRAAFRLSAEPNTATCRG